MPSIVHIAWFLIIGAMAGWLAGILTKGSGFGIVGNVVIGATGALVGGHILHFAGFPTERGFIPSLFTSLVGALALLLIFNLLRRK
jgi:uncharacterized membrane protein YeaQ/YmgE (transglycosylase-associated protein family)